MHSWRLRSLVKWITLTLLMAIIARLKADHCVKRAYEPIYEGGPPLPPDEILSSHSVGGSVGVAAIKCLSLCRKDSECVGFNVKASFNDENCQITNVTKSKNENKSKRGEWKLFRDFEVAKRENERKTDSNRTSQGTSCFDIKKKGLSQGDGKYLIDPDGKGQGNPFEVYCDMTSFGGGWTMCYTTDSHVNIKTELTTTLAHGYRADCNKIPFTGVIFVDEATKEKAAFNKSGPAVTFSGNYNKKADVFRLWTAQGVASTDYKYQMLICDTDFYKGLHFSGYIDGCFKECDVWCNDNNSPYFRTSPVSYPDYQGVAFNENGHRMLSNRLISAGIR